MQKISIIIPCYATGFDLLLEAIYSIEMQTYKNWEIIFIDDCSPNQEWKLLSLHSLYSNGKIKIFQNKTNMGAGLARNKGVENCSGDIILFLDSDDKYH